MTENRNDRTGIIAVVAAIVALLLGLCLGAIVGGLGGYFIGRGETRNSGGQLPVPWVTPVPQRQTPQAPSTPGIPQTPRVPGLSRRSGVLVQEVVKGTPAEQAGLKVGDVITKVNDTTLDSSHRLIDVLAGYKPNDQITLTVSRLGSTQTITVKLGENPDDSKKAYLGIRYAEMGPVTPGPNE